MNKRLSTLVCVLGLAALSCAKASERPSLRDAAASQAADTGAALPDAQTLDGASATDARDSSDAAALQACKVREVQSDMVMLDERGLDIPWGTPVALAGDVASVTANELRVETSPGHLWTLTKSHLPIGFGVLAGSRVSVNYLRSTDGAINTALIVEVSISAGDTLAFHFRRGWSYDSLDLADQIRVRRAQALCTTTEDCGTWSEYAMDVSVGKRALLTLGQNEQAVQAGYRFWHELTKQQRAGDGVACDDWGVSASAFAVTHEKPLLVVAGAGCVVSMSSDLPGIRIELDPSVCVFTLAQAAAGITIPYELIVDVPVENLIPATQDAGQCGTHALAGLFIGESLAGQSESYCECDVGLCAGLPKKSMTLAQGSYDAVFSWMGRNWSGPSDTGNPQGTAFPAGSYTLTITTSGEVATTPFHITASLPLTLKN
jgi:hypothetical protein